MTYPAIVSDNHRQLSERDAIIAERDATIATLREALARPKNKTPASRQLVNLSKAFWEDAESDVSELLALLKRAEEELRLIRMKDCAVVYDVGLRMEMRLAIAKHEE